jgi:hypothetical protein
MSGLVKDNSLSQFEGAVETVKMKKMSIRQAATAFDLSKIAL